MGKDIPQKVYQRNMHLYRGLHLEMYFHDGVNLLSLFTRSDFGNLRISSE